MKKNVWLVISCAVVSMSGPGCGMMKNLDEMHEKTVKMAGTTEHMADTTDKMAGTTDKMATTTEQMKTQTEHMSQTTDHMSQTTDKMSGNVATTACVAGETYSALRQGNTLISRVGDNSLGKMETSGAIEDKIFHAGAYMKAFEFQIWNCEDPDSQRYLQEFYQEAAEEFTRVLPNYLTTDRSKWSVSPTSTNNWVNNLYAISVTLQELNANIVTAYKMGKWSFKPQSLLDLIESSLSRKVYLAAHPEQTTLMDHEFLANEPLLVQLLQIRMNFLAAMSLAKVSNLEEKGFLGLPGLLSGAKMLLFGWTPNLWNLGKAYDVEQIRHYTRFLYGSNDMRFFLQSIGVQPIMDNQIWKMYAHMKTGGIVQPKIQNPKTDREFAFNNVQDAIQGYLDQVDIFFNPEKFKKIPALDHPEFFSN